MRIASAVHRPRGLLTGLATLLLFGAAAVAGAEETLIDPTTAPRQLIVESLSAAPTPGSNAGGAALALAVEFELTAAMLTAQGRAILDIVAPLMNDPALLAATFIVEGHTDASGAAQHNVTLSQRRAESVRDYLAAHGVAKARLSTAGYGSARPLPGLSPADGRNRRVTLVREF